MSKTGRGILRDPGPYFCLYSPECVEEEFCELRLYGVLRSTHADEVCEEVLKALEETEG